MDFLYEHIIHRGPPPPGHVLVPLNFDQWDLRACNILVAPGTSGKDYRAPKSLTANKDVTDALLEANAPTLSLVESGDVLAILPRGTSVLVSNAACLRIVFGKASPLYDSKPINAKNASVAAKHVIDVLQKLNEIDVDSSSKYRQYAETIISCIEIRSRGGSLGII